MSVNGRPVPKIPKVEDFLSKIFAQEDGCWMWINKPHHTGYGTYSIKGSDYQAHRVSYSLFVGEINPKFVIDHKCKNKRCVNPDHLRQVTQKVNSTENSNSVCAKAKAKSFCVNGHEFSNENTRLTSSRRRCRACDREKSKNYRDRKKEKLKC